MMNPEQIQPLDLVLGVDGGGTKTEAWLCRREGDEKSLGQGRAGPSNPRVVGLETAGRNIVAAVREAMLDGGMLLDRENDADSATPLPVSVLCAAVAGAGREPDQLALQNHLERDRLAEKVHVVHDGAAVLAAATPQRLGVALIAGTGSFAYGENSQGASARSGGWGYLLGDEGGGYWIARAGLRAVVRAVDGRSVASDLRARLFDRLRVTQPEQLVDAVYHNALTPRDIALLADEVLDAALAGDAAAAEIVEQAAFELSDLVKPLVARLTLPSNGFPLALAGGVITASPLLQSRIQEILAQDGFQPSTVELAVHPVLGAVRLARLG